MNSTGVRNMGRQVILGVLAFLAVLGFLARLGMHSIAQPLRVQTEQRQRPITIPPTAGAVITEPAILSADLSPHVIAIPSLDGTELYIQADKLPLATGRFYANVSVGPGHEKDAWTMTYSTTQSALTSIALGFTPLESAYGSMSITGTAGTVTYSTNELEFSRAFVPMSDKLISEWSPDGLVELQLSPSAITHDTYLVMMSSFAPPGAPAAGSSLASPSYSIRLADPVAQTSSPVLLRFYLDGLPAAGCGLALAADQPLGCQPGALGRAKNPSQYR